MNSLNSKYQHNTVIQQKNALQTQAQIALNIRQQQRI